MLVIFLVLTFFFSHTQSVIIYPKMFYFDTHVLKFQTTIIFPYRVADRPYYVIVDTGSSKTIIGEKFSNKRPQSTDCKPIKFKAEYGTSHGKDDSKLCYNNYEKEVPKIFDGLKMRLDIGQLLDYEKHKPDSQICRHILEKIRGVGACQ